MATSPSANPIPALVALVRNCQSPTGQKKALTAAALARGPSPKPHHCIVSYDRSDYFETLFKDDNALLFGADCFRIEVASCMQQQSANVPLGRRGRSIAPAAGASGDDNTDLPFGSPNPRVISLSRRRSWDSAMSTASDVPSLASSVATASSDASEAADFASEGEHKVAIHDTDPTPTFSLPQPKAIPRPLSPIKTSSVLPPALRSLVTGPRAPVAPDLVKTRSNEPTLILSRACAVAPAPRKTSTKDSRQQARALITSNLQREMWRHSSIKPKPKPAPVRWRASRKQPPPYNPVCTAQMTATFFKLERKWYAPLYPLIDRWDALW